MNKKMFNCSLLLLVAVFSLLIVAVLFYGPKLNVGTSETHQCAEAIGVAPVRALQDPNAPAFKYLLIGEQVTVITMTDPLYIKTASGQYGYVSMGKMRFVPCK